MSISSVSSASLPTARPTAAPASPARAADGDYKTANAKSAKVKDADGDYKPTAAASSTAAKGSAAVQCALATLKVGG